MTTLDPISIVIGALVSLVVAVAGYFFTQVVFFQNRIIWAPGRFEGEGFFVRIDEPLKHVAIAFVRTLVQVKGWKPVRDVKIYVDGDITDFDISPNVPHKIIRESGAPTYVLFGALNPGRYVVKLQNRGVHDHISVSLSGIEATNATTIKRDIDRLKFEIPIWLQAVRTGLFFPTVFVSLYGLVSLILRMATPE